jgi:hypothetical protein
MMKMEFSLVSFLAGCAVGAGAVLLAPRLKPVLVEMLTGAFKLWDAALAQVHVRREDLEDVIAEARARARGEVTPEPRPEATAAA